jgi:hypothetical protein
MSAKLEPHQKNDIERGVVDADVQFVGLAYQQGKEIVFRFITEYSSLRDFGPLE